MNNQNVQHEESVLKDQILTYLRYWLWFLISVLIFGMLAFLYLRYSTSTYQSEATILIKDENNSALSELAAFEDLGLAGAGLSKSAFENEIEIVKSRRLLLQVVDNLNLEVRYFKQGNVKASEIFSEKPFFVRQFKPIDSTDNVLRNFQIKIVSPSSFEHIQGEGGSSKTFLFGEKAITDKYTFTLIPNLEMLKRKENFDSETYLIAVSNQEDATTSLRDKLNVQTVNKNSSVIKIALIDNNIGKSEAILNEIIRVYNNDAILDRNEVSKSTADFIDRRLAIITEELDSVELGKVAFRRENRITDIQAEGQIFLETASELSRKQLEVATKIDMIGSMKQYLESGQSTDLLPTNIGADTGASSNTIQSYNELVLERKRLLRSATESNPAVVALSEQIDELRSNVLTNLNNVTSSLQIENRDLLSQRGALSGQLSRIPDIAKSARGIERQQGIKEALYLYLLEKREETAISLAVTSPKAKVVDYAYSPKSPVSPKPSIIYLSSLVLGLLIPFGFIYGKQLLDTKIHNRLEVEKEIPNMSILGEIPTVDSKESETIINDDRSVLAEAFRILRTNLGYFLQSKGKDAGNVIFVTSTIKGEGKTFVAYNLALSLRSTGKSVLLIGADIRNPQLHRYIDKNEWTIGLAEYLFSEDVKIDSILNQAGSDDVEMDLILSGKIPPNPAELLMNQRFDHLIEEVRGAYDYVIVDTAPTLLVTDTLLISQKADMTVYVCRAEFTDSKLLQYPKELVEEGKLRNVAFAINGIKITNFGYGSKYGYGYGYGQDKSTLSQRIKRRLGIGA